ncbi:hypothetical protein [Agaribacter flavus]|uniref:Uncharacterized protein n=1 Tax=Agaribacter flavus TaxID=1902781 RepID=A0ABV7FQT6_9ALTE
MTNNFVELLNKTRASQSCEDPVKSLHLINEYKVNQYFRRHIMIRSEVYVNTVKFFACIFAVLSFESIADVRLWVSDATTNGAIGARAGADAFCQSDINRPSVASSTTRAFISINLSDRVLDMPTLYSIPQNEVIRSADGITLIAANFAALLNTDTTPLLAPVDTTVTEVFTGSSFFGGLLNSCAFFSDASGMFPGTIGNPSLTSQTYLTIGPSDCITPRPLYCITYTAPSAVNSSIDLIDLY